MPRQRREPPADHESQVRSARLQESVDRDNEIKALRKILSDEDVRDFLWRAMEKTQMFQEAMNNNFGIVGHNLGRAAIGKWLLSEITEADYNAWLLMQQKHYARQLEQAALAELEAIPPE